MKKRHTNPIDGTLALVISAVWIPTFWALGELPWTLNEKREASALLRYVDHDLDTVDYVISKAHCEKKSNGKYSDLFCEPKLTTSTGDSFAEVIVFTLVILGAQYLLTGKVTLRFKKAAKEEDS